MELSDIISIIIDYEIEQIIDVMQREYLIEIMKKCENIKFDAIFRKILIYS